MSKVAILFNVYPKENLTDQTAASIKEKMNPAGMQIEEVAFGIKVIKVMFKFDDSQKSSSKIEDELKKVDGVGEIEVVEEGLI